MALLKFALDLGLADEKMLVDSLRKDPGTDRGALKNITHELERVKNESFSR